MRLFAAVVPPDDVIETLESFLAPRRESDSSLRWSVPEQWHFTLAFCANAPERALDELRERLERAGHRRAPFELAIAAGGAFPNAARARVLYAAASGDERAMEEMRRLATGARAAFSKSGCRVDGARFTPHVTLARLGRPSDVVRWLRVLDTLRTRSFRVDEIALIESHLGEGPRRRPRYEVLDRFPLGKHHPTGNEVVTGAD